MTLRLAVRTQCRSKHSALGSNLNSTRWSKYTEHAAKTLGIRRTEVKSAADVHTPNATGGRFEGIPKTGWLTPIAQEPRRKNVCDKQTSRRLSNKGGLPMTLQENLQLVD